MKQQILLTVALLSLTFVRAQLLKDKFFGWDGIQPSGLSLIIDDTYKLYIRSVCRKEHNDYNEPVRTTVVNQDCQHLSEPTVLIERQYLYYSAVHKSGKGDCYAPHISSRSSDGRLY